MSEQTKLDSYEKESLKIMLEEFEGNYGRMFSNPDAGVTVAVLPHFKGARFAKLAVAYAAGDERKFRRKVGQYLALTRLECGECITLPIDIAMETAFLLTD